jgi:hypothetical protein
MILTGTLAVSGLMLVLDRAFVSRLCGRRRVGGGRVRGIVELLASSEAELWGHRKGRNGS